MSQQHKNEQQTRPFGVDVSAVSDEHYERMVGEVVVTHGVRIEGTLTDFYREGGQVIGVIHEEYEVDLTGAVVCYDVRGAWRRLNPHLPCVFIRRASSTPIH